MTAITVAAKGKISLPQDILEHLGVHPGSKLDVHRLADGCLRIKAAGTTGKISDAFGVLKREGHEPVSIEEVNEVTAKGRAGAL